MERIEIFGGGTYGESLGLEAFKPLAKDLAGRELADLEDESRGECLSSGLVTQEGIVVSTPEGRMLRKTAQTAERICKDGPSAGCGNGFQDGGKLGGVVGYDTTDGNDAIERTDVF